MGYYFTLVIYVSVVIFNFTHSSGGSKSLIGQVTIFKNGHKNFQNMYLQSLCWYKQSDLIVKKQFS